jgi:hypothetical protein
MKAPRWLPLIIAFSPAVLLPLVQNVVRPRVHHPTAFVLLLASAPNLIIGFCFPFSILVRPSAWTRRTADWLFALWCAFTLSVLVAVEYLSPFGLNYFDPHDIVASIVGVALAIVLYVAVLRTRLAFAPTDSG